MIWLAGFGFWQSDLRSDPPMHFSGFGQSLSTDPAQYTYHARNKILFGEFDPFDHPRWVVYQNSITSAVAWLWFSLVGVSLRQSNMVGVLLSLGSFLLFMLGLARHHRNWVVAVTVFCLVANVTLLTHGRLSYLENGLLFIASGMFFVYSRWGNRLWGIFLAGGLVSAAMLAGKLFGGLLLPALLLSVWFSPGGNRLRSVFAALAGWVLATLSLLAILYGQDLIAAVSYVLEQSYGLRGFPRGLESPWAFVEHFVSYGFGNHLYFLNPELLLILIVGAVMAARFNLGHEHISPATRLTFFWVLLAQTGLAPLNYSPIRYSLLLIPAIIILGLTILDTTYRRKPSDKGSTGSWQVILLGFGVWLGLFHLVGNVFFLNTFPHPVSILTWSTLPVAALATYMLKRWLTGRSSRRRDNRLWIIMLAAILSLTAVTNSVRIWKYHLAEKNFNIVEAAADLSAILGQGAVLSGAHGPMLTTDNRLKSFIHLFQVAEVDERLFERSPITHLALDKTDMKEAIKNYPALEGMTLVTSYWIRDVEVGLYQIHHLSNNPLARQYRLSVFEWAMEHFQAGRFDSAEALAFPFYTAHPESKSAGLLVGELLLRSGAQGEVQNVVLSLARRFPTDFNIQLRCGQFLQILALQRRDQALLNTAESFYARAVSVNPYRSVYARNIWDQTARQLRGVQRQPG